jgi:DNA-binding LytR/AlgR family response regulator
MRLVRKTISELEQEVPSDQFERIHKSFLVNISKVKSIESNQVRIGEMLLPIGKSYLVSTKKRMTGG